MSNVTEILNQIRDGKPAVSEELMPLVYDELRKLPTARLSPEQPGHSLIATALVHEACLRLVGGKIWTKTGIFSATETSSLLETILPQFDL